MHTRSKIASAATALALGLSAMSFASPAAAAEETIEDYLGLGEGDSLAQIGEVDVESAEKKLDNIRIGDPDKGDDYDVVEQFGGWATGEDSSDTEYCGDTRNDVLNRDLDDVKYVEDNDCQVASGVLTKDPYTGAKIDFTRGVGSSMDVQIDHMVPRKGAWVTGAAEWTQEEREAFTNDPDNLVAVYGPANGSKGDKAPGDWTPKGYTPSDEDYQNQYDDRYECQFAAHYTWVAEKYDLTITTETKKAIAKALDECAIAQEEEPTEEPTETPTDEPTDEPSEEPTDEPSETPTEDPTEDPTDEPSETPTDDPSDKPTETPSDKPSETPSDDPSETPSEKPTEDPSETPSDEPTEDPIEEPTDDPVETGDPGPASPAPTETSTGGNGSDGSGSDEEPAVKSTMTVTPHTISKADFLAKGVAVRFAGFSEGEKITLTVSSDAGRVDSATFNLTADSKGQAAQGVKAVVEAFEGSYSVKASGDSADFTDSFTVSDDQAAAGSSEDDSSAGGSNGSLPRTGGTAMQASLAGGVLLAVGAAIIYLARRKKADGA